MSRPQRINESELERNEYVKGVTDELQVSEGDCCRRYERVLIASCLVREELGLEMGIHARIRSRHDWLVPCWRDCECVGRLDMSPS